jgi:CO/xanthine dehydrogenase Mo-binding subunit
MRHGVVRRLHRSPQRRGDSQLRHAPQGSGRQENHHQITADAGRITQSNFHNYPVARLKQAPARIDVTIVDSEAPHSGVGEPGVPVMAPALTAAIFAAAGKRIRDLPIKRTKLV